MSPYPFSDLHKLGHSQTLSLGPYGQEVEETLARVEREQWIRRIWQREANLWKEDPQAQELIRNSLGWLTVAETMLERVGELQSFACEAQEEGFDFLLLLGMGGSSLCSEVLRRSFGQIEGFPQLLVLDSTVPAAVAAREAEINLTRTLFLVASKSGTTTEPLMFERYFFHRVSERIPDGAGAHFVAITDPGSQLDALAQQKGFRRVFRNMADIGGRYSALSFFGMLPAALMGLDVGLLLERAAASCQASERSAPASENPGARLGAALGQLASRGRDKITLVIPPPIDSLGLWIEQLIAESTGKEGRGLIPVAQEPLETPEVYGEDRVFVSIQIEAHQDAELAGQLKALEEAGHPVIRHVLKDRLSLGQEFFYWEFATALGGALMGINPFDQPNVQESKDNTRQLLEVYARERALPEPRLLIEESGCRLYGAPDFDSAGKNLADHLGVLLDGLRQGDYLALLAYLPETKEIDRLLEKIRLSIRRRFKVATTQGYGPRFLHSTGQLHKGGGDEGVFIQITAEDPKDLAIPEETFTFGILKQAQASGDFQSLIQRRRRALRLHLGRDVIQGLQILLRSVEAQ